jgi:hypothetical protein
VTDLDPAIFKGRYAQAAPSMLLRPDPSLAEVPGFSRHQIDALARSVELRRQQLEQDIADYIKHRQDELRAYEQEVHPPAAVQAAAAACPHLAKLWMLIWL